VVKVIKPWFKPGQPLRKALDNAYLILEFSSEQSDPHYFHIGMLNLVTLQMACMYLVRDPDAGNQAIARAAGNIALRAVPDEQMCGAAHVWDRLGVASVPTSWNRVDLDVHWRLRPLIIALGPRSCVESFRPCEVEAQYAMPEATDIWSPCDSDSKDTTLPADEPLSTDPSDSGTEEDDSEVDYLAEDEGEQNKREVTEGARRKVGRRKARVRVHAGEAAEPRRRWQRRVHKAVTKAAADEASEEDPQAAGESAGAGDGAGSEAGESPGHPGPGSPGAGPGSPGLPGPKHATDKLHKHHDQAVHQNVGVLSQESCQDRLDARLSNVCVSVVHC
jgi:hypothetical protein